LAGAGPLGIQSIPEKLSITSLHRFQLSMHLTITTTSSSFEIISNHRMTHSRIFI